MFFSVLSTLIFLPRVLGQCIVTVAGTITAIDGVPATTQQLVGPYGVAVDTLYGGYVITEINGHTLRRIWPNGTTTTMLGIWRGSGAAADGPVSNLTMLSNPSGIIPDGNDGYYIADRGNNVIRRLYANGTLIRIAGNTSGRFTSGDGPATSGTLNAPNFLSLDSSGGLWITEQSK